ncbi:rhamnogalacturonan acetylesterase [Proteiniphilum sp. X52]|uniref:rhamnogalacturonan acetylesterase n=1 Tax=Proteiniphilum sp. X52 TaxID=2382159 RepID=UPI000F0A41BD|nr:rhamnogalacturonan acetylesterase [Proteiniphilum sp. X52]RNC66386.1 rhamnogalacturonan acetylesterase [Proteiniphilum sp. X52]
MRSRIIPCILLIVSMILINCSGGEEGTAKILMMGDSTMADKPLSKSVTDTITGETFEEPFLERGWGQLLPELVSGGTEVLNYGRNGRSTRTFIEEGLWTELYDNITPGDVVIIQFGHNDGVVTKRSYTMPAQFRLNFVAFVNEVKDAGGHPVLCTPVARRRFDDSGHLVPTHGEYPDIIRSVAKQTNVPLIDMEEMTSEWLQNAGVEGSNAFFHKLPPGVSRLYPNGLDDNTHLNEEGARGVAQLFVSEVKKQGLTPLVRLLNDH